ncbi:mitochondrial carnitine/acylcarnitine carrier protein-like protein [Dinothrombium tinctorium]|uniref:Mitochondrial carnitine/acylcarnitine carrier protein-like protein n=1 Tax=Dinothrombium tinctorium TaxID=1965070 RepID=A0A3S3P6H1_9ACAR|nr:mitochondrial carnitine/acylcarnitine carrier protein-like protein [Dinothrombium tinctorium]RWS06227.1 mitochondrial carnitine/acylcarnitine carrier protein-like protein [Dinothrombium tinctorium]
MSKEEIIELAKDLIAGAVSGVCGVIVGHPFDTIKVKLQTMPIPGEGEAPRYSGSFDCGRKIIVREGFFKGLFKGVSAPILSGTPINAACFFSYGVGKQLQQTNLDDKLTYTQVFIAGMISGLGSVLVITPSERVKCLIQAEEGSSHRKYKGAFDCTFKILKTEGLKGMFKGTAITSVREIPASGLYFLTYEWLKNHLSKESSKEHQSSIPVIVAGGFAGMAYWTLALPSDIIKSRVQTEPGNDHRLLRMFTSLVKYEGILTFYRGFDAVLIRAFPTNAIIFLTYELTMKCLNFLFPHV